MPSARKIRLHLPNRLASAAGVCMLLLFAFAYIMLTPIGAFAGAVETASVACARDLTPANTAPGEAIVRTVFRTIQTLLDKIGGVMYRTIVDNTQFKVIINAIAGLYIATYGVMIMLNLAPHSVAEVTTRMVRLAIFYALIAFGTGGYAFFDKYVVQFFLGGMNQLMFNFTAAASGLPPPPNLPFSTVAGSPTLDVNAVSALYAPMNIVFKPFYPIAILGLLTCGPVGWFFAFALAYGFYEFLMMVFGAIIAYVRSMVGLTFLFGVAPIFIAFLLFKTTREIFRGWLNQVVSFAIAPVMLFAFLSFYALLITSVLESMFKNINFCRVKWFSFSGTSLDISWWRPAVWEYNGTEWNWQVYGGDWADAVGTPLPPPISLVSVIFFLVIAHLGKIFCQEIGKIANKISDGFGSAYENASTSGSFMQNQLTRGSTGRAGMGEAFNASGGRTTGANVGASG